MAEKDLMATDSLELVPSVKESEDFLTISPSLFHILCHVEHKDILNIRLVCRRLNEATTNNSKHLPRLEARLHLEFRNYDKNMVLSTVCLENDSKTECWLSEKGTEIIQCHNKLLGSSLEEEEKIDANSLEHGQNSSISFKLRTLLEILFLRYDFSSITIENGFFVLQQYEEEYCGVIGEVFKASRSKCNDLAVERITWSALETLYMKLAPSGDIVLRRMEAKSEKSFSSFLTRYHYNISVDMTTSFTFSMVYDVLRRWESAALRFTHLGMTNTGGQPNVREVCVDLMAVKWFDMDFKTVDDRRCLIKFKRSMDDQALLLVYEVDEKAATVTAKFFTSKKQHHRMF